MRTSHAVWRSGVGLWILGTSLSPRAQAVEFSLTGYGSLVAGQILEGDAAGGTELLQCPCYISDWGIGAAYTGTGISLRQESRLGAQLQLTFTPELSAYVQAVARAYDEVIKLDWAYLSYQITPEFSLQVGRKRIPIFYYSEFQDVGYAYNWVRPPNELYGWDLTNYNGASLRYRTSFGDYTLTTSLYAGSSQQNASPYWKINHKEPIDSRWNDLYGADMELSAGPWTSRLVYLQSQNQYNFDHQGWGDYDFNLGEKTHQKVLGWANNWEWPHFLILSELNATKIESQGVKLLSPSGTLGFGFRSGPWLVLPNYAQYADFYQIPEGEAGARYDDRSLTVRYEVTEKSDLKLQYTYTKDFMSPPYLGNTQHLSMAYDFIF